jgi:hypothetical protein
MLFLSLWNWYVGLLLVIETIPRGNKSVEVEFETLDIFEVLAQVDCLEPIEVVVNIKLKAVQTLIYI